MLISDWCIVTCLAAKLRFRNDRRIVRFTNKNHSLLLNTLILTSIGKKRWTSAGFGVAVVAQFEKYNYRYNFLERSFGHESDIVWRVHNHLRDRVWSNKCVLTCPDRICILAVFQFHSPLVKTQNIRQFESRPSHCICTPIGWIWSQNAGVSTLTITSQIVGKRL